MGEFHVKTLVDQFTGLGAAAKVDVGPTTDMKRFERAEVYQESNGQHVMRVFHGAFWPGHPVVEYRVEQLDDGRWYYDSAMF